ncbi:hypothetical protein [Paenibacillus polymyxa]|uniref:hypothetical protein n=1 Tax=Paenibacillus polymyxa TaxID=1406 RepID=UPI003D2C9BCB
MKKQAAPLNEYQVAMLAQQENINHLTLFQEDQYDNEAGGYQPAKSFSITDINALRVLRDLLIAANLG